MERMTIPISWYKTIKKEKSLGGKIESKPHFEAITTLAYILSEFERRKLDPNKDLDISYLQLIRAIGYSDKDARGAILFLEKEGLILRKFRTITIEGNIRVSNFMSIKIYPENISNLSK